MDSSYWNEALKEEKGTIGISPFGVWRKTRTRMKRYEGWSNHYDDLYADILLWLKNDGSITWPQLYWEFTQPMLRMEVIGHGTSTPMVHCYID
jgi:hypothetical protein